MENDISQTKDSLQQFDSSDKSPSGTLAVLDEEYSSFWQGPGLNEMAAELGLREKRFVAIDKEQAAALIKVFYLIQGRGRPYLTPTPPAILRDALSSPDNVHEKAYLVLIYGALLTEACLDAKYSQTTRTQLRWNLRLAIDDARLLLEPSDLNIQALMILAFHVQEVTTPSLSWMVFSTICRMLQALGIDLRNLEPEVRERRIMLFWTFNAIDKNLAVIFGRPPALHNSTGANVPTLPVHKLMAYRPHQVGKDGTPNSFQSTYGAHFLYFLHRSSEVLTEIWSCLFEDSSKFDSAREKLDEWHQKMISTLEACLVAEQPFLDEEEQTSMRLGIQYQQFQYYYYTVLLIRSRPALQEACISSAQQALFSLEDLVSDSSEVYNGVIWVLLYCPFTPFFILFGQIISTGSNSSSRQSLKAMESMSSFLQQMESRHPQAAKLRTIAVTFVQYAQQIFARPSTTTPERVHAARTESTPSLSSGVMTADTTPDALLTLNPLQAHNTHQQHSQPLLDLFNDPAMQDLSMDMDFWLPNNDAAFQSDALSDGMGGTLAGGRTNNDAYGFFADSNFDWLSWDSMTDMTMQ